MRGFVSCDSCGEPYTSCWSKGAIKHHPYYLCDTKGCPEYRKSIRRDDLEGQFQEVLAAIKPAPGMVALAKAMFRDMWDQLHGVQTASVAALKVELKKLETAEERLMDRILASTEAALVASYERRLGLIGKDKVAIREKLVGSAKPAANFDAVYRTAFDFLENPQKLWASSQFEHRRAVLRMAFDTHLRYARNQGYRTPETTLPFKVLAGLDGQKEKMVPPVRLERTLPCGKQILSLSRLPIPPRGRRNGCTMAIPAKTVNPVGRRLLQDSPGGI